MATGKQLKAIIPARRAAKKLRKKRTRPEPRHYTVGDLDRARDRPRSVESPTVTAAIPTGDEQD